MGMHEIESNEAYTFLKSRVGEWIYVKLINNVYDTCNSQVGVYSKFKLRNIEFGYGTILLYGEEDNDRVFVDEDGILGFQVSDFGDELLIRYAKGDCVSELYIKQYLQSKAGRLEDLLYSKKNLIVTEGKTDWKHLKRAFNRLVKDGKYEDLDFEFFEYDFNMGDDKLWDVCKYNSYFNNQNIKVFIFDADVDKINKFHSGQEFHYYGNNVYSMILPVPSNRSNTPNISIENYYTDEEITISDSNGRRLYLAKEFDDNGVLYSDSRIRDLDYTKHRNKSQNYIIDDKVMHTEANAIEYGLEELRVVGKNVALSKDSFANYILDGKAPYDIVGYKTFSLIFDVIQKIQKSSKTDYYTFESANCVKRKWIADNVEICEFKEGLFALEIHMEENDENHVGEMLGEEIDYVNGNITIRIIGVTDETVEISIPMGADLYNFLKSKITSQYNRIELYLHKGEDVRLIELFRDEISAALIERALFKCEDFY